MEATAEGGNHEEDTVPGEAEEGRSGPEVHTEGRTSTAAAGTVPVPTEVDRASGVASLVSAVEARTASEADVASELVDASGQPDETQGQTAASPNLEPVQLLQTRQQRPAGHVQWPQPRPVAESACPCAAAAAGCSNH